MIKSQVLFKTSTFTHQQKTERCPHSCMLKWRQNKLLVRRGDVANHPCLSTLENEQRLTECLKRSPVKLVSLDYELGETQLNRWADACEQAGKPVFLRIPSLRELPRKRRPLNWFLKRIIDVLAASFLLLVLSPILLLLAFWVRMSSPGPIFFKQWRIGKRGRFFRILKFRTMVVDAEKQHHQVMGDMPGLHKREDDPRVTPLGRWMRKYSLDELPQLVNVVRGELSLVGPRPWALYDAVRLSPEGRRRLNARPGITGSWQVEARSTLLDLETVNHWDLDYLRRWSVRQDLMLLLKTVPKVLSGFGAY
ncbi:heterocyst development glycosyltransferase HepC [Coleofasciculus sp. G2-EDA-02]|uniref:heterocyst development glycosyltransferase HepC n=1 Tax=Coleofasciculus sp. G2-EDA-02 TaxID=3069529 RepID=UPI0032F1B4DA